MRFTKRLAVILIAGTFCTAVAGAAPSPELLDLAARIHFGYYHGEARTVEAAQLALDRLGDGPEVLYYRDFAALRRVQLGAVERSAVARLKMCAEREVSPRLDKPVAAEAWVLVAACALWLGDERRRHEALARAHGLDADNPRIVLVEAWALDRASGKDEPRSDAAATKFEEAVAAFDAWSPSIDDPDWGDAEALTALAGAVLRRGQVRAARDLVERALLSAPDYRRALELRTAIQGSRDTSRLL